jgi:hypothetical protein
MTSRLGRGFIGFAVGLGLLLSLRPMVRAEAQGARRPRLLLSEADAFTSLPALRAKFAAGARPSDDLPGWALTWLLAGDDSFARRALDDLRTDPADKHKGSDPKDTAAPPRPAAP